MMAAETEAQQKHIVEKPRPTPITLTHAQFLSWKRHKDVTALARKAGASRKHAEDTAEGTIQIDGQELFLIKP